MTPQQTEAVAERLREITKKNPTQAGLFRRVYHDKPSLTAAGTGLKWQKMSKTEKQSSINCRAS